MSQPVKAQKNTIKIPPHNEDAEKSVLGSILIDKNSIHRVADLLVPDDFYVPIHEIIYRYIIELYEKRQPIDIMSVTNILKEKKLLQEIGGSSYLADLTSHVTTASHVDHYAQIVKEKKVLRDLIRTSGEITEHAFDEGQEFEDLIDGIEQKILAISQKSMPQNFIAIKDELKTAYERIEKLHAHQGAIRGVPTGFQQIDSLLSGLQKSDLVILGARPSLGKTSLALDMARNAANQGFKVGLFSLEMSREQIIDRMIAAESTVSLWKLRTGRITEEGDFQLIQSALDKLSNVSIYIDDTASPTIMQMRAMARRLQVEFGLDLLVIDYLQLVLPRRNSDNMVQQVTEISRGLKALARELNVPVLALSQLSRGVDQRDDKRPKLHDLRESGSIEQDADVVMFIYRKDRDRADIPPEEQNSAEIIIAKHRNGPLGVVELKFDPDRATFHDIDRRHTEFTNDLTDLN
jgi:replicative DNA helicase